MENNKEYWDKLKRPPLEALKTIRGGRLSGMTDIKPQWRYEVMTDVFGPCGIGWYFDIIKQWIEEGTDSQRCAFANIEMFIKDGDKWSAPIPGTGGSMLVAKEKAGPHTSDECFKMAVTDALSTAMKMIGVGADIYAGQFDGTKYKEAGKELADYIVLMDAAKDYEDLKRIYQDNLADIKRDGFVADVSSYNKQLVDAAGWVKDE